jgi:hypothetical protein
MVRTSTVATITFRSDVLSKAHSTTTGVLHGIRYIDDGTEEAREQNVFCWVRDSSHLEKVGDYLKKRKYDEATLVFVPYSTRDNWMRRYPLAVPTLECTKEGIVVDREKSSVNNAKTSEIIPTIAVNVEKRERREFDDYLQKLVEFKAEHGHVDGEFHCAMLDFSSMGFDAFYLCFIVANNALVFFSAKPV